LGRIKMNSSAAVKSKKAENKKKQKKIIAEKLKKSKLGLIPMLAVVIILALFSIQIINNLDLIAKNKEHIESQKKEYNHKRIKNEEWQYKIDAKVDDEFIREIARQQKYRDRDEDIYIFQEGE
jgi:competence protein ComGC